MILMKTKMSKQKYQLTLGTAETTPNKVLIATVWLDLLASSRVGKELFATLFLFSSVVGKKCLTQIFAADLLAMFKLNIISPVSESHWNGMSKMLRKRHECYLIAGLKNLIKLIVIDWQHLLWNRIKSLYTWLEEELFKMELFDHWREVCWSRIRWMHRPTWSPSRFNSFNWRWMKLLESTRWHSWCVKMPFRS